MGMHNKIYSRVLTAKVEILFKVLLVLATFLTTFRVQLFSVFSIQINNLIQSCFNIYLQLGTLRSFVCFLVVSLGNFLTRVFVILFFSLFLLIFFTGCDFCALPFDTSINKT